MLLEDKLKDPWQFEELLNPASGVGTSPQIDMSGVTFVEPFSMVAFLLLGRNHLRDTGERIILRNIPLNIHQYLNRMDFFSHGIFLEQEPLDSRFMLKKNSATNSLIEVTAIPGKERESLKVISSVISVFRARGNRIMKQWLTDNAVDLFVTVISELCQNIFEHSLDSGLMAMQSYSYGREKVMRLVIADSGIGIRESFESADGFVIESTASMIEAAYSTPISSKREHGYGLCQVKAIVERMKGSVYIRSGDGSLTAIYGRKTGTPNIYLKNGLSRFRGTQISISLHG
jgi:anti-sigma regulatory factor (Ser/Thr protein kinase)